MKTYDTLKTLHVYKSKYVRKGGKTTWSYRFEMPYRRTDGKRDFVTKSGFITKADAQKAGQEKYDEIYNGNSPNKSSKDTKIGYLQFSDYVNTYWISFKENLVKNSSMSGYLKLLDNLIFPRFTKKAIKDISTEDLEQFLNEEIYLNSTISNNTLINVRALLRQIFNFAVKNGHIKSNPLLLATVHNSRIQPNKVKRTQCRNAIDEKTLSQIFELYPKGTKEHLALKLMQHTGMRLGEVFALDWRDISFENHTIYLVRQVQRKEKNYKPNSYEKTLIEKTPSLKNFKWYISNPKYDSCRAIPMTKEIEELLKAEFTTQRINKIKYEEKYKRYYYTRRTEPVYYTNFSSFNNRNNRVNGEDYENGILNDVGIGYEFYPVFRRENGTYYNSGNMQYVSRKIHGYENNELISDTFNIHSLRHTYASRMRSLGFEEYIIQSLLGHKKNSTTTDRYMHLEESVFFQVIKRINNENNIYDYIATLTIEEQQAIIENIKNKQLCI